MGSLNIEPNVVAPDDFYQALIDLHRDLSDEQSELVNARLILLLANHIGDLDVLREAMRRARESIEEYSNHGDTESTEKSTFEN